MPELMPLDQIRLDWQGHKAALRWIGLLYRRPKVVKAGSDKMGRGSRFVPGLLISLHASPYLVLFLALDGWVLHLGPLPTWGAGGSLPPFWLFDLGAGLTTGLAVGLAVGIAFSTGFGPAFGVGGFLAFGIASGIVGGFYPALSFGHNLVAFEGGIAVGFIMGFAIDIALAGVTGTSSSIAIGSAAALIYLLLRDVVLTPDFQLGSTLGGVLGLFASSSRVAYFPIHFFLLWRGSEPGLYRLHPVAWDDQCRIPFPFLDRILVRCSSQNFGEGSLEIDRLIDTYPSQRNAALRARATLLARQAAASTDLVRLDDLLTKLPEGKKGFLQETPELRRRVHEIAALQARIETLDRPFLREPFAALLVKEIEAFEQQIAGFRQPLSTEFRHAARNWLEIARNQHKAAQVAVAREPTRQVFRAGDPVDREKEAFVERAGILGELERQVMLAAGCLGPLVYGRRRVGKSSAQAFQPLACRRVRGAALRAGVLGAGGDRAHSGRDGLIERESTLPGELDYLRRFARADVQPIPEDDAIDRSLRRRLLVVPEGDGYRLRAPIMGRWMRR